MGCWFNLLWFIPTTSHNFTIIFHHKNFAQCYTVNKNGLIHTVTLTQIIRIIRAFIFTSCFIITFHSTDQYQNLFASINFNQSHSLTLIIVL